MFSQELLRKLFSYSISHLEFETSDLLTLGFGYHDIFLLIENKIITRLNNKTFKLTDAEGLYNYGKSIFNNNPNLATKCFLQAFCLDPIIGINETFFNLNAKDYIEENSDAYHFDINKYIDLFNEAISTKNLIKAEYYFKIIEKALKINLTTLDLSEYRNALYQLSISNNHQQIKTRNYDRISRRILNSFNQGKDVYVLYNVTNQESKRIIKAFTQIYPDFAANFINEYNLLIIKKQMKIKDFNLSKTIQDAKKLYAQKRFGACISLIRKALYHMHTPPSTIYGLIGLCLYHLKKYKDASTYFFISTILKGRMNFSNELKEKDPVKYEILLKGKPYIDIKIDEFKDDYYSYYDISEIEEIANLIAFDASNIDELCQKFGLNHYKTLLVKLIIARDSFINGFDIQGNKLLNEVQKTPNKNEQVFNLMNYIQRNKKFLKNRRQDNTPPLVLRSQNTQN